MPEIVECVYCGRDITGLMPFCSCRTDEALAKRDEDVRRLKAMRKKIDNYFKVRIRPKL